jgi:hypothetical protein
MSDDSQKPQPIILFFGAGASVDAGIPDTYKFVDDFEAKLESLTDTNDPGRKLLYSILEMRKGFNEKVFGKEKSRVDIEQMLETISRLIDSGGDVLLYSHDPTILDNLDEQEKNQLRLLKKELEDFVRETVVVRDEGKLEYLKELFKFLPIEIYSVNYDTCIEQLCYMNHLRYTDGFNITWDAQNFKGDFDVRHYKLHGSAVWYENTRTRECVKIPVLAFSNGKPTKLQLIYREDVEPLLVYPAQKREYVEPLTELQLMFKKRIVNKETQILVIVGYSFRDDYVIHMLWDAARKNEKLYVLIVNPEAQSLFESRLRFINRIKRDRSRIWDRVLCLPYPFSSVIYELSDYVRKLRNVSNWWQNYLEQERGGGKANWADLLWQCIECEFLEKAEQVLEEKIRKGWTEIVGDKFDSRGKIILSAKALLHSISAQDAFTDRWFRDRWLKRFNDSVEFLNVERLRVSADAAGFLITLEIGVGETPSLKTVNDQWICPIIAERNRILKLLGPTFKDKLNKTEKSFRRLEEFQKYLVQFSGRIEWEKYLSIRGNIEETRRIPELLKNSSNTQRFDEIGKMVLELEKRELTEILGGKAFHFEL